MAAQKKESWESRIWRWGGNIFPAYRRTGAKVVYVSPDFDEVHIKLPSNWKTRNHMGITWGGSLYGALDPIYGVMLYKILGYKYRVIDKTASIHFKRPVKTTLFAKFFIGQIELKDIRKDLQVTPKVERHFEVDLVDQWGVVHASCKKQLSISSVKK